MTMNWYAMQSHPNKEEALWRQLQNRSIEVFYPRLRVNPVNPRSKKVKPYFPRYLFIHVDLNQIGISEIKYIPYAIGVISFGGEPAIVPDNLIVSIKQRVEEIQEAGGENFVNLKSGDAVVIENGPFEGYEAIFNTKIPGSNRVQVLLKMLNDRQLPVELKAGGIKKIKK